MSNTGWFILIVVFIALICMRIPRGLTQDEADTLQRLKEEENAKRFYEMTKER